MTENFKIKPPSAIRVEESVLGAMMIDKESVPKALELLKPDSFYVTAHQIIFEAMMCLFDNSRPIDTVSLYEELKKREQLDEIGGAVYLSKLTQDVSSSANIDFHCKVLIEKQILRNLITEAHEIAHLAYDGTEDAFDILDQAEKKIFDITEKHLTTTYKPMEKIVQNAIKYIKEVHEKGHSSFTIPTGFYEVDGILGGLQNSDLIILAGRPSMGKTALALTIARNIAIEGQIPVGIFSLEMSDMQLVMRLLASEGKVDAHDMRTGKLSNNSQRGLVDNSAKLLKAPIYIDDSPSQSVLQIRAKARRLKAEKNVGAIIVDYLQLMDGHKGAESREREISHISRSLKSLAKELDIPVIALSQLNRSVETRHDKRPQLSDLRESGAIEQDADVVMFVNRPEYYGIEKDANGKSLHGFAEIIISKHRSGPTGIAKLVFIQEYAKFENLAREEYPESYIPTEEYEDII